MEEQKILFADLYRLTESLRGEVKDLQKKIGFTLNGDEWDRITLTVNDIVAEAALISRLSMAIEECCDMFLKGGPYEGQGAGRLPLEAMA